MSKSSRVPTSPAISALPVVTNYDILAKYFVPLTDAKFQDYINGRKRCAKLMCRSSEFNQDKTTLIVTNNPLPDLNSSQRKDTPMKFFCKEHLRRGIDARSQLHLPPLKTQQLTEAGINFDEGKVGKSLQFSRFSTDNDFKTEGQFSKSYAERRLLKLYPHLHFQAFPRLATEDVQSLPRKDSKPTRETSCQWEPLTLSSLFEAKPTVNAPGKNGFRCGKVSQWVVNSSFVDSSK
ncbi:testis-specific gene 13 protein [Caretta caretta]|uniref:testis-specific gene 13 protein n=1 Tax=Caretta caretta TaxID=8467 RepID=UPI003F4B1C6E